MLVRLERLLGGEVEDGDSASTTISPRPMRTSVSGGFGGGDEAKLFHTAKKAVDERGKTPVIISAQLSCPSLKDSPSGQTDRRFWRNAASKERDFSSRYVILDLVPHLTVVVCYKNMKPYRSYKMAPHKSVGLVYDKRVELHRMGLEVDYPERPLRTRAVWDILQDSVSFLYLGCRCHNCYLH